MNDRRIEITLWSIAVAGSLLAGVRTAAVEPKDEAFSASLVEMPGPAIRREDGAVLGAAARIVEENNPFRLDRVPAPLGFATDPQQQAAEEMTELSFRPTLALHGISGPPWQALISGLSSDDRHLVVRSGDRFGELRILSIGRDEVVIVGTDTTWTLTIPR